MTTSVPGFIKSFKVTIEVTDDTGESAQLLRIDCVNNVASEEIDVDSTIGGGVPGAKLAYNLLNAAQQAVLETAGIPSPEDLRDAEGATKQ